MLTFGGQIVVLGALLAGTCLVNGLPYKTADNGTQIVLTHVIFRHGERTTYQFYPNDPNKNNTFFPIGLGGLTNNGKFGEFSLGRYLRGEYDNLLGPHYTDDIIDTRSTDTTRTIQSAQLVLAGLFPPTEEQKWHNELAWQPIPVFSKKRAEEDLIHPEECSKKLEVLKNLPNRPEVQEVFIKPYEDLFKFIEDNSGMRIRTVHDLLEFYFIVNTEIDMNLTVPAWVNTIYPEPLYSTSTLAYSYQNYDEDVKKINCGYLLQKIINDNLQKIEQGAKHKNMKMFLYSGHESTIGFMLHGLRLTTSAHVPPYGSALMFELHKNERQEYFIKIRYRQKTKAQVLSIPGCNVLCPLQQFITLQKNLLPTLEVLEACKL